MLAFAPAVIAQSVQDGYSTPGSNALTDVAGSTPPAPPAPPAPTVAPPGGATGPADIGSLSGGGDDQDVLGSDDGGSDDGSVLGAGISDDGSGGGGLPVATAGDPALTDGSTLPFTGLDVMFAALAGIGILMLGFFLRRAVGRDPSGV